MKTIPPMDSYESAHARLADAGLYQVVIRQADVEAFNTSLPHGWERHDQVTPAEGYPEAGTRFVHAERLRILRLALDGEWERLSPSEQAYARNRGVPDRL